MNAMRAALTLAAGGLILAGPAAAQEAEKPQQAEPAMSMPKPGPEHELFEEDAGTWDAIVEMWAAPGTQPIVHKGTETNTIGCGGLCLITDFKSEMVGGMGGLFHGHGTTAWDPTKKRYVGSWTDSMSAGISFGESSYDPDTKTAQGYHCPYQVSEVIETDRIWKSINPDVAEIAPDHAKEDKKAMNHSRPKSRRVKCVRYRLSRTTE